MPAGAGTLGARSTVRHRIESSPRAQSTGRSRPVVLVLAIALAALGVWLLGRRESAEVSGTGASSTAPAAAQAPRFDAQPDQGAPANAATAPEQAAPLEGSRPPEGWRELRGVAVRACDEEAAVGATIIAVPHDTVSASEERWLQARVARDGSFSLWAPPQVDGYRVLLPSAGDPSDGRVPVRMEGPEGEGQVRDVRLVLDSGWRLDLVLVDGAGHRLAGVLAQGGSRSARSDAEGRCTLLDLPVGTGPLALTLHSGPGDRITTEAVVDPPPDGSLRKDATLTVP
jgi:hypothetical protein